jgi:hypothetical protein
MIYGISMQAYGQGIHLQRALQNDRAVAGLITADEMNTLFNLTSATGQCAEMTDRVINMIDLAGS